MKKVIFLLLLTLNWYSCQIRAVDNPENIATAKKIINLFEKQDFSAITSLFDEKMNAAINAEGLEKIWNDLNQKHGSFKSQGEPETLHTQGYDIVRVPCIFENGTAKLQLAFDEKGKVAGMYVLPE